MNQNLYTGLLFGLLIIVGGCGKKTYYKPKPLKPLNELKQIDYQNTQQEVTIRAKLLTNDDCHEIFEDRADRLEGIVPIQISIENNSSQTWLLLAKNMGIKLEKNITILNRLGTRHNPLFWALATFGIGTLVTLTFGIPLVFLVGIPVCSACHVNALAFFGCAIPTIAGLTAALYGTPIAFASALIADWHQNSDLSAYVKETVLAKITISPNCMIDRLIFVKPRDYRQQFDLSLINNENTESLIFQVTLPDLSSHTEEHMSK